MKPKTSTYYYRRMMQRKRRWERAKRLVAGVTRDLMYHSTPEKRQEMYEHGLRSARKQL